MVKEKACVFISGTGSNLKSIIYNSRDPGFPIKINLVLCNNKNASFNFFYHCNLPYVFILLPLYTKPIS